VDQWSYFRRMGDVFGDALSSPYLFDRIAASVEPSSNALVSIRSPILVRIWLTHSSGGKPEVVSLLAVPGAGIKDSNNCSAVIFAYLVPTEPPMRYEMPALQFISSRPGLLGTTKPSDWWKTPKPARKPVRSLRRNWMPTL